MTDDELVADVLIAWEAAFDQGTDETANELCRDCPHLTDRVAERIGRLKATEWLRRTTPGPAPAPMHREGDVLAGNYRLEGPLGEGGYGVVWRAVDLTLQRPVAVKVTRRRSAAPAGDDPVLAEARRIVQFKHPGIVPVHFIGRDGDSYFIVSELIDGESLAVRLARGPLAVPEAVRVVREVAGVLAHAHNRGFIHRDVKPANILLDRDGRAYLTDFGIAVAMAAASGFEWEAAGTPAYMAPESVRDDGPVTGLCDVFALGVVLYEALTGRHPFWAKDVSDFGAAVFDRPVIRPQRLNSRVPAFVDKACLRCLEKEPGKRFATADALAAALAPPRRRVAKWCAAAAVILATSSSANPLMQYVRLRPWDAYLFPVQEIPRPHQLGDLSRAVAGFTEAISLDPDDADALYNRGLALLHLHEEDLAVADFTTALGLRPGDAQAYLHRGVAFYRLASNDLAVADLTEAIRHDPRCPDAYFWRASVWLEKREYPQAISDLFKALHLRKDDAAILHKLGYAFYVKGETDIAKYYLDAALGLRPDDAEVLYNRGLVHLQIHNEGLAEIDFTTALRLRPNDARLYLYRGIAHYRLHWDEGAVADFTEAVRLNPRDADAYYWRGFVFHSRGDYDRAIADYTETLRLRPGNGDVYRLRGRAHLQKQEYSAAVEDFNQAMQLAPKSPLAYAGLAWVRAACPEKTYRDGKRAVEVATRACELGGWDEPDSVEALAAAYAEVGRLDEAVKYQRQAMACPGFGKDDPKAVAAAQRRLKLYEQGRPYRGEPNW